ncbi:odorant receptor 59a-like [Teleopsis dalmanni]|uniref:odorant receptor 59a-like n=1 Tax=Teleopsis dalmanni TaxID=139649 RepID=UPI0018CD9749|nr:odorant receptor 59a-like [Teleopsis dalmanni]
MAVLDSTRFFRLSYTFWTLLGINNNQTGWKKLYWIYGILINLFFPISFCCSLFVGLLQPQTFQEKLESVVVFISALSCCAQFLIYALKIKDIKEVDHILRKLDERILCNEEINIFEEMSSDIQNMTQFFGWSYLAVGVMAILSGISNMFQSQHRLLYSAWLPFDWHNSALAFCIAGSFQLLALFFCIAQNFADDSFPPISLRLLTGHLSCLEFRISTIGHRSFDHPYRIVTLQLSIQDQLALYE